MKSTHPQNPSLHRPTTASIRGLLLAAALAFVLVGTAEARPKLEYRVVDAKLQSRLLEAMLNRQAAEGWELVELTPAVAVFVRRK